MANKPAPTDYFSTGLVGKGSARFAITGMAETLEVFNQLAEQIGDKKKSSKILVDAVKKAMFPVLNMAKQLAPKGDTHLLANSLTINGRRPTSKDKKSQYINNSDTVIAIVTTKKIPKKLKNQFSQQNFALLSDYSSSIKNSWQRANTYKMARSKKKSFFASLGYTYDGRAPANEWGTKTEFGTAHNAASPFMRPALDTKGKEAAELLGKILMEKIQQYRAKHL